MQPLIHPKLVNEPFGDPGLYLEFKFRRYAMLFDLGDLSPLSPRQLLRVCDVFVSHAHMDHFIGFDQLLRIMIGRPKTLRLFGPTGFIDKVECKLRAYEWNLIHDNPQVLTIEANEFKSDEIISTAAFSSRRGFAREDLDDSSAPDGKLADHEGVTIHAAILDHGIPCLAFRIEEPIHINVWRERLIEMGLGVGPWLRDAKSAILRGAPDDTEIHAEWRDDGGFQHRTCTLGILRERAFRTEPGQTIAYVVDASFSAENAGKIIALARNADRLYIEAMFLDEDAAHAAERRHLTARQAGELARRAGVKRITPFHFSPRYRGREELLEQEAIEAFLSPHSADRP